METTILVKGSRSAHMENVVTALLAGSEENKKSNMDNDAPLQKEEH